VTCLILMVERQLQVAALLDLCASVVSTLVARIVGPHAVGPWCCWTPEVDAVDPGPGTL